MPKAYASPRDTLPRLTKIINNLEADHQDRAGGRSCRSGDGVEERIGQDADFGDAVQHAVGAEDRQVDRAGEDQNSRRTRPGRSATAGPIRPDHVHRQPPMRLPRILLHPRAVRNHRHGQERDRWPSAANCTRKTMNAAFLKFWSWALHFAVHLRQRLLAAHRQDRVGEGQQQADQSDQANQLPGCATAWANSGQWPMKPSGSS